MCSLVAHDEKLLAYEDDESSVRDRLITKHMTTEALESLGDTINYINIWIKLLEDNYDSRHVAYITSMKEMFKQILLTMIKALNPKQKVQKRMT